ncbi:MAG: universal stress protein [Actinomycetales bacterium]|nr:universal stress protein [Actinomycetales bacterium]
MPQDDPYEGRVVVGFDGSDTAQRAVRWAAAEAAARGRGLVLVHAVLPPVATGGLGVGLPPSLDLVEQLEEQARSQLDEYAAGITGAGVTTHVAIGAPSAVLLEASETADLVVIGSRGRGGFSGLLLGSVGGQVSAHAECPVAVIRDLPGEDAGGIVVGIDGSPAATAALAFAFDEASRRGWTLTAVHAWDVPAYDLLIVPNGPVPVPLADVADDEVRLTAEILAGFRDDYPDVEVEERLVRAPAVQALVDASAGAAMAVVGTHGHGPAMGALLGSVSNGLLHKSKVPVVVVPPTPEEVSAA